MTSARQVVSTGGGTRVGFRPDGQELYYVSADRRVMAVPIAVGSSGVELGTPRALMPVRVSDTYRGAIEIAGTEPRLHLIVEDAAPPMASLVLGFQNSGRPR